jgi:hypothetical protein
MVSGGYNAQADGAGDTFAQSWLPVRAPKKAFVCTAIVTGLKLRMQTADLVEKNLAYTRNQIQTLIDWTLPNADLKRKTKSLFLDRMKGVLSQPRRTGPVALETLTSPEEILAFSFQGQEAVQSFLVEIARAQQLYRELILNSSQRISSKYKQSAQILAATLGVALFSGFALNEVLEFIQAEPGAYDVLDGIIGGIGVSVGLAEFGGALTSFIRDRNADSIRFLSQVARAMERGGGSSRLLFYSKDYLLLPDTYREALDRGMVSGSTLESESEERPYGPPFSLRKMLGLSGVGASNPQHRIRVLVDLIFDGGGGNPSLHVVVRSKLEETKDQKRKKKKPQIQVIPEGELSPVRISNQ